VIKQRCKETLWDDVLRKAALRPGEFKPRAAGIYSLRLSRVDALWDCVARVYGGGGGCAGGSVPLGAVPALSCCGEVSLGGNHMIIYYKPLQQNCVLNTKFKPGDSVAKQGDPVGRRTAQGRTPAGRIQAARRRCL